MLIVIVVPICVSMNFVASLMTIQVVFLAIIVASVKHVMLIIMLIILAHALPVHQVLSVLPVLYIPIHVQNHQDLVLNTMIVFA